MNSHQAKKLNLPEIMARLGYQPLKEAKGGLEFWYSSPFRAEKEASFHTTYKGGKWIWNDFGDSGGTIIDFVMRHEHYNSVSQALGFLDGLSGRVGGQLNKTPSFSFHQQPKAAVAAENFRDLELVSAKPVSSSAIFRYLTEERKIAFDLIKLYLKEVRYKNLKQGKEYFAFGTENIAGGYEIRAASDKFKFKSALVERQLTFFEGSRPELGIVDVFEGTTDFLSLLTMMKTKRLTGDTVIMNSISNYQNVLKFIQEKYYKSVNLFLDNDKGGHQTTARFIEDLGGDLVHNQSPMFLPHVDVNAALMEGKTKSIFISN